MLKNYTPHAVVIEKPDGTKLELPSLGVIRVGTLTAPHAKVEGIPVFKVMYGPLEGLPEDVGPEDVLVVSMVVRDFARKIYHDLADRMVSPDSGPTAVRNEKGHIVAVKALLAA